MEADKPILEQGQLHLAQSPLMELVILVELL